jgi:hypothetical protein
LVTFHDINTDGVRRALGCIAETHPEFQCLNIPDLGTGLAIVRRRLSPGN